MGTQTTWACARRSSWVCGGCSLSRGPLAPSSAPTRTGDQGPRPQECAETGQRPFPTTRPGDTDSWGTHVSRHTCFLRCTCPHFKQPDVQCVSFSSSNKTWLECLLGQRVQLLLKEALYFFIFWIITAQKRF